MAQLAGVQVEKLQGGLQRLAVGTDNHLAMILTNMSETSLHTQVHNEGRGLVIHSVFDAEQVGFNESFDANNELNYYDQIVEFFRLAPEGVLYLFSTDDTAEVKAFLNANKEVKGYAIDFVSATGSELQEADINAQQQLINELAESNRLIDFAVVCVTNELPDIDLFDLECPNVSVSVACEKADKLASIGAVLGMLAVRKVSENIGSVDIENKPLRKRGTTDYPLTDAVLGRWTEAYLADGQAVMDLDKSVLNQITGKGYITAASYEGYPGFFFENSATAVERSSDFAFIENNRVWNKAARIIRTTLLPRVKSKVKKDPNTGFIASTTASYWRTLLEKALQRMVNEDDISGFDVQIDHKQIVNSTEPVKVKALIVADGIVHEFEVAIGLTNNIE